MYSEGSFRSFAIGPFLSMVVLSSGTVGRDYRKAVEVAQLPLIFFDARLKVNFRSREYTHRSFVKNIRPSNRFGTRDGRSENGPLFFYWSGDTRGVPVAAAANGEPFVATNAAAAFLHWLSVELDV